MDAFHPECFLPKKYLSPKISKKVFFYQNNWPWMYNFFVQKFTGDFQVTYTLKILNGKFIGQGFDTK